MFGNDIVIPKLWSVKTEAVQGLPLVSVMSSLQHSPMHVTDTDICANRACAISHGGQSQRPPWGKRYFFSFFGVNLYFSDMSS